MKYLAAVLLALASPAIAEQLTTDQVIALNAAGVGDDAIVAKIRSSGSRFDLDTDQMLRLRQQGISPAVLAAMVNSGSVGGTTMQPESGDAAAPHPIGLYLAKHVDGHATMARMDFAAAAQMKTGGFIGSAFSYGIAPIKTKAIVPGSSANLRTGDTQPVFYLFLRESNPEGMASPAAYLDPMAMASSPQQFVLIRLDRKADHRETTVMRANIGGAQTGSMDKDRVEVRSDQVRHAVYKLSPAVPLAPGEYAFLYSASGTQYGGAAAARIFDFAVQ